MTTLHLGVLDMPYADEAGTTTGDVAEILEERYGIMQTFFDRYGPEIAAILEKNMASSLETLLMGGPANPNPLAGAEGEVKELFDRFITMREVEQPARFVGEFSIPTDAAVEGRSHRFKGKLNKGKGGTAPGTRRASFYDTGLFLSAFRAWVE